MPRQKNDGRGRLGGRKKGTPNKTTAETRRALMGIVNQLTDSAPVDLEALEPIQRLEILVKLLPYICRKAEGYNYGEQGAGDFDDSGFM